VVVERFRRFAEKVGTAFPSLVWVAVLERHRSGALHVHVLASEYVRKERVARLWGHGFVDLRKVRARSGREAARAAARYASKYVAKAPVAGVGEHRYMVRQGFQPARVRVEGGDRRAVWYELVRLMGGEVPSYEWWSESEAEWRGPPVGFLAWG
jgi:hypothetical protein